MQSSFLTLLVEKHSNTKDEKNYNLRLLFSIFFPYQIGKPHLDFFKKTEKHSLNREESHKNINTKNFSIYLVKSVSFLIKEKQILIVTFNRVYISQIFVFLFE